MSPWTTVRPRAAGVLILVALVLGWAAPGWAPNCPSGCRPTTTSRHLLLDDILNLDLLDGQTDPIPLTGDVHVVVHATPTTGGAFDVRVLVNLHGVGGVGGLTGTSYVAAGAARFEIQGLAPSTDHEIIGTFALGLHPPEPVFPPEPVYPPEPVLPLRVQFSLQADGTVLEPTVGVHVP